MDVFLHSLTDHFYLCKSTIILYPFKPILFCSSASFWWRCFVWASGSIKIASNNPGVGNPATLHMIKIHLFKPLRCSARFFVVVVLFKTHHCSPTKPNGWKYHYFFVVIVNSITRNISISFWWILMDSFAMINFSLLSIVVPLSWCCRVAATTTTTAAA